MRFEAKHNYFKKLVDNINNFKNITYSLAMRHQALQTYRMQSSQGNYLRVSLEIGPGKGAIINYWGGGPVKFLNLHPKKSCPPQIKALSLSLNAGPKFFGPSQIKAP